MLTHSIYKLSGQGVGAAGVTTSPLQRMYVYVNGPLILLLILD